MGFLTVVLQTVFAFVFIFNLDVRVHADSGSSSGVHEEDGGRGIVVCSGSGDMFIETITMIEQTRHKVNSTLPIAVAHCNELSPELISILSQIPKVSVIDICTIEPKLMSIQKRIKGFFCKPAAILASPFAETMIVDSDVIWFDNPDRLFESEAFKTTGTLFFRDRWTRTKNKLTLTQGTQNPTHTFNYINDMIRSMKSHGYSHKDFASVTHSNHKHSHGMHHHQLDNISSTAVADRLEASTLTRTNAYWQDFANGKRDSSLDHWQDSSVLLICKSAHPRLLAVLQHMLRDFNIGYGDKEMYWIAATVAQEPFRFEPHLSGLYCNCQWVYLEH
jgi:hypothetical protein